ncbi:MAG: EAL domain-containing protein [Paracoccaceae bacterium]|jgi:EAL domain-containing protein (putative c-di-GMP-specific phosphodiesterase class I)|nr:EAL domain-containing protein [Paracoccaceae bacterium]
MAQNGKLVLERGMKSPLGHVEEAIYAATIETVDAAVRGGNCALAFQPIVLASNPKKPAFYEGLIRVFDPAKRVIPARDFIAQVEDTETGRLIDCEALKKTIRILDKVAGLHLSLNVSARSIGYAPWTNKLHSTIRKRPDLVKRMTIEISEKSTMQLPEVTARFVNDLSEKGMRFLLDDFGAGLSSFQHMRDIGFGMLKIDGRYTSGIAQNAENQSVINSMIALGDFMQKRIIATRVENKADMKWLQQAGVDAFQGYLFGTPTLNPAWIDGDVSAQPSQ